MDIGTWWVTKCQIGLSDWTHTHTHTHTHRHTHTQDHTSPLTLKLCANSPQPFHIFSLRLVVSQSFPDSSVSKEFACNAGDPGSIPGLGRSTGEGIGYPLQYSWPSLVAQLVKNLPAMQETWVGKIPRRRERLPTPVFWPGESHWLYSPGGHKESDMTEQLSLSVLSQTPTHTTWNLTSVCLVLSFLDIFIYNVRSSSAFV